MLFLAVFFAFISVLMLSYMLLMFIFKDKIAVMNRMEYVEKIDKNIIVEEGESFSNRAILPIYNMIGSAFLKLTPGYKVKVKQRKLEKAGILKNTTPEKWVANKIIFIVTASGSVGLLSYFVEPNLFKAVGITGLIVVCINVFFRFYVSKKITARGNAIVRALPFTLDLITVSVEAGLSLDGAIARIVNNIEGELSDEFGRTLKEMKMGIEKKYALRNMSERCGVKELSALVTSLIQADELGVSLGKILRIEGEQMRERRKQAAREKAMKAPVKMLFPLLIFIFPAIFVVILGPAVIQVMNIF